MIYIKDDIKKLFKDPNSLNDDKIKEVVKYCSDHIEKPNIIKNTSFLDKTICFSNLYETKNPKEFVVLSLYIVNNGGRVIGRVTSSNYYIKHVDDEIDVNSIRYKVAIKQLANEKIQIMSYDDLLSILNLTNEQVLNTTYDEYRYKLQRRQNKQKKHKGLCVELKQYLNDDLLNDTEDE